MTEKRIVTGARYDPDIAAQVVADAEALGSAKAAAAKWGINEKTVRRYQSRVKNGPPPTVIKRVPRAHVRADTPDSADMSEAADSAGQDTSADSQRTAAQPRARARVEGETRHTAIVEKRIEHIADRMRALTFRTGETVQELAAEWKMAPATVSQYAAEASRRVLEEMSDPDLQKVSVTLTVQKILQGALDDIEKPPTVSEGPDGEVTFESRNRSRDIALKAIDRLMVLFLPKGTKHVPEEERAAPVQIVVRYPEGVAVAAQVARPLALAAPMNAPAEEVDGGGGDEEDRESAE